MMPSNNLSLALYHNLGTFSKVKNNILSVNMKAYSSQEVAGSQEPFSQYNDKAKFPFGSANTAGYTLWGMGYESKVDIMGQDAKIVVNVDNLFDVKYRNFLDTYKGYALGTGRNVSFSLSVPFAL
jgi:iron complex outermembrane receptor protein/hemoglobin/transferrin/lactoferrin receptor protein